MHKKFSAFKCAPHITQFNAAAHAKQRAETLNTTVRNTVIQITLQQTNWKDFTLA